MNSGSNPALEQVLGGRGVLMKKRLSLVAAALLLRGLAYSQNQVQVQIDANGVVIPAHQVIHIRNAQVVAWGPVTQGGTWFVRFVGRAPCAEGAAFGHDQRLRICTINGSPGTYRYGSGRNANQRQLADPVIIVDQ
jgi:hypothetical protein